MNQLKRINRFMEAIYTLPSKQFPGTELRVLLFLGRKIIGWNKYEDRISGSQAQAAVGIRESKFNKSVHALEKAGLISIQPGGGRSQISTYQINEDYGSWPSNLPPHGNVFSDKNLPLCGQKPSPVGTETFPSGDENLPAQGIHNRDKQENLQKRKDNSFLSEEIYRDYAARVRPGGETEALTGIAELLAGSNGQAPYTKEQLTSFIDNYVSSPDFPSEPESKFRFQANTFFGPKEHFRDFLSPAKNKAVRPQDEVFEDPREKRKSMGLSV